MGDGLSLTLRCSYTEDEDLGTNFRLDILRIDLSFYDFRRSIQIGRFQRYTWFNMGAITADCLSNWNNVCEISFDPSGDNFAGYLTISHPSYDSIVETGLFQCRLWTSEFGNIFINITGNY